MTIPKSILKSSYDRFGNIPKYVNFDSIHDDDENEGINDLVEV
jgi:hypothetical protein